MRTCHRRRDNRETERSDSDVIEIDDESNNSNNHHIDILQRLPLRGTHRIRQRTVRYIETMDMFVR